jgi:hypothetical protein
MAGSSKQWVTVGSILTGLFMLGCCFCGAAGYVGLMVMARIDQKNKQDPNVHQGRRLDALKSVALGIERFGDTHLRTPADLNELKPFLEDDVALDRIRKGDIAVVWNAELGRVQEAGSSSVLIAWETQPTSDGKRLVVFMDALARPISESEFLKTPKAKTKPR